MPESTEGPARRQESRSIPAALIRSSAVPAALSSTPQGFVFVLAHEDDVKMPTVAREVRQHPGRHQRPSAAEGQERHSRRSMPKRRSTEQYWTEGQFDKLRAAPPGRLSSRGTLPWRLLAYWLEASPEVDKIRELVSKRLMRGKRLEASQKSLTAC